jgi:hypothetical protein
MPDSALAATLAEVRQTRAEVVAFRADLEADRQLSPALVAWLDRLVAHVDGQVDYLRELVRDAELRVLNASLAASPF